MSDLHDGDEEEKLKQEKPGQRVCFCGIPAEDADRMCTERDCPFKSPRRC